MDKPCKDCKAQGITTKRVLAVDCKGRLQPGPRCVTHYRERKRELSSAAHGRRLATVYGITDTEYWAIYEAQNGRCYICHRATGRTKRLAVDHDHTCTAGHDPKVACRQCVRGLLCKTCNSVVLGRYSAAALRRAIHYLDYPPAQEILLGLDE
jgi:hypothetical protein